MGTIVVVDYVTDRPIATLNKCDLPLLFSPKDIKEELFRSMDINYDEEVYTVEN